MAANSLDDLDAALANLEDFVLNGDPSTTYADSSDEDEPPPPPPPPLEDDAPAVALLGRHHQLGNSVDELPRAFGQPQHRQQSLPELNKQQYIGPRLPPSLVPPPSAVPLPATPFTNLTLKAGSAGSADSTLARPQNQNQNNAPPPTAPKPGTVSAVNTQQQQPPASFYQTQYQTRGQQQQQINQQPPQHFQTQYQQPQYQYQQQQQQQNYQQQNYQQQNYQQQQQQLQQQAPLVANGFATAPRMKTAPTLEDFMGAPATPPPQPRDGLPTSSSNFHLNMANLSDTQMLLYETAPQGPPVNASLVPPPLPPKPHVAYTAQFAINTSPVRPFSALPPLPAAANQPPPQKRIIEVVASDGSLSKKLDVTDDITAMDLLNKFAVKARLEDSGYFSLAVPERGYFRWINLNLPLRVQNVPDRVFLKVQFIMTPKVFQDGVAIQYYWMQINEQILAGVYPVSDYLAVKLAALSMQARLGNFNPAVHRMGYFHQTGNSIAEYLPAAHIAKYKIEYWERRIFVQLSKYFGVSELDARLEYIRVAKKSPSYGATVFEILSGAHALIGGAEDGVLLSRLKNSKCGDWTFIPYQQFQSMRKYGNCLELVIGDGTKPPQTMKIGMQDAIMNAAFECIADYHALYRLRTEADFVPPTTRFLPPLEAYDVNFKRTLLADFPSRIEYFKESYVKATTGANTRPLLFVLEQLDFNLDLGRDCEYLNLSAANLDPDTWRLIRNALLDTFSFRPDKGQIFVENFNCKLLKLSQNPRLTADSYLSLIQPLTAEFPVTELDLSMSGLEDEKIIKSLADVIAHCRSLQGIHLRENKMGSKAASKILAAVKTNLGFRSLDLSGCDLKDSFCNILAAVIATHPALTEIDLSNNPVSDDGLLKMIDGMKRNRKLSKLNMSGTKIKSQSVKPLIDACMAIGAPNFVQVAGTKLSDRTSEKIAALIRQPGPAGVLKLLDVQQCQLSKKAMLNIFKALESNQTIEALFVGDNEFDKQSLVALAGSLRASTMLKVLSLKSSTLGPEGYHELGGALRGTTSLRELDISFNTMTSSDLRKITEGLVLNKTLVQLNISYNPKISIDGVASFLAPFQSNANTKLSKLLMDGCSLGDDGAKRVGEMLGLNTSLERLSLRENNITGIGAASIFNGLKRNRHLAHLSLERNDLGLATSQTLTDLKNSVSSIRIIQVDKTSR